MTDKKGPLEVSGESEIYICKCMQSQYWPYCDSSHHGMGGGGPEKVILDKNKTYYLCRCYRTKTSPFCDGSHNS